MTAAEAPAVRCPKCGEGIPVVEKIGRVYLCTACAYHWPVS